MGLSAFGMHNIHDDEMSLNKDLEYDFDNFKILPDDYKNMNIKSKRDSITKKNRELKSQL